MGQDLPKPPAPPRKNLHPDAGAASPVVLRALAALQREQPTFPKGVDIQDDPFDDMYAFTNMQGSVSPEQPNLIRMNPALGMLYPENDVKRVIAHEGHHINQLRRGLGEEMKAIMRSTPYEDRMHEQDADMYAQSLNIPEATVEERIPSYRFDDVPRNLYESGPIPALKRKFLKDAK